MAFTVSVNPDTYEISIAKNDRGDWRLVTDPEAMPAVFHGFGGENTVTVFANTIWDTSELVVVASNIMEPIRIERCECDTESEEEHINELIAKVCDY